MEDEYYTTKQVAEHLQLSIKAIYNRIWDHKIRPQAKRGRVHLYLLDQFVKRKETIIKYYPLKTTETFYVYQSKINNK